MTGQIAPAGTPAPIQVERVAPRAGDSHAKVLTPDAKLPPGGKASPQPAPAPAALAQASADHVRAAVDEFVKRAGRELEFSIDDKSGRTVMIVRNKATGELVRQIPAEEVLRLADAMTKSGAMLWDHQA
jgi:flagellar protein FlaG